METISNKEFIDSYCQVMGVQEFIDCFFAGGVSRAAAAFNVSRQTMHAWAVDEDYEIQVVYHQFETGKATYDYILKKQVKRVGAASSEFTEKVGYIYAVSNGTITKVGCSVSPKDRVKVVASSLGFDSYDVFISNPTNNYKKIESDVHRKLSHLLRDNTIYQRECFSCSIGDAVSAIKPMITGIESGPRETASGLFNRVSTKIFGKGIN